MLAGVGRGVALVAFMAAAGTAAPAQAWAAEDLDSRWLGWLGCWQATQAAGVSETVCVVPASEGSGIELITYAGGAELGREALVADGTRRTLSEGGCTGWESAEWASDNRRVHLRSELTCEGGHTRTLSGVIAFATPTEWLDIQVVGSADEAIGRGVRVVRYRAVSGEQARMLGAAVPTERVLAVEMARRANAVPLTIATVLEDVAALDREAVEALLVERAARFPLNARRLVELDGAGVPTEVIDLMVALSNPQRFAIDHAARSGDVRPAQPRTGDVAAFDDRYRTGGYYGRGGIGRFDPFDPYNRYGYGLGYGSYGYGYGSPYRGGYYYGGYQPVIVVVSPEGESASRGGRVVRGSGFTRSPDVTSPPRPASTSGTTGSASGSSSAGAPSSSGSSSGETGRTARPRTEAGGGGQEDGAK
jgi:hypothetical protein